MWSLQELKSISRLKKKEKHNKIVLLGKDNLNTIEILISKALINSYISHHELISVNNVLREYNETKEEIKNYVEKKYTVNKKFRCQRN